MVVWAGGGNGREPFCDQVLFPFAILEVLILANRPSHRIAVTFLASYDDSNA